MNRLFKQFLSWMKNHLPLLMVVTVGLVIAATNINLTKSYSGWDNIVAEFNLLRYARQVFFGAWIEHQGLGAPAAQGHLSEIPRLPILFALKIFLPDNLIRYAYIFITYLIGGLGVYAYLNKIWLKTKPENLRPWLAMVGGVFYLLHILTLQQFYIAFEMFMAQFAFLPWLILYLHQFALSDKKQKLIEIFTACRLLLFTLLQLLIAPSAHTPTVFYLGVVFSLLYVFWLNFKKHHFKAAKIAFLVGFLTFVTNAYWIIPNLYYGIHNSHYVAESRDNQLFGPESVGSIREAGTFANLAGGTQYLFKWRDYNFSQQQFDFIFNDWDEHLANPFVFIVMQTLGIMTLLGLFTTILDRKKGAARFAVIGIYLFCLMLIWIDLFPTSNFVDYLYRSDSFLEAFRNPFTKLSIIYTFVSVLLFINFTELLAALIIRKKFVFYKNAALVKAMAGVLLVVMVFQAWPSFQGHFISEKLQLQYPDQYQEMFAYLQTRDKDLRILQLPQLSHAGWEYYDWRFLGEDNGYQGMGFYFFGFPQAFLHRDSDRWVETSDFFYHELKHALDQKNVDHLQDIFAKYNADLVVVDETKVEPTRPHDFDKDYQLLAEAGLRQVWQKDFLTIFEREDYLSEQELLAPKQIRLVSANTDRVKTDVVFHRGGDYILTDENSAQIIYPFADLAAHQLKSATFTDNGIETYAQVPEGDYDLLLPGLADDELIVSAAINFSGNTVAVIFPTTTIEASKTKIVLPKLNNFQFQVDDNDIEELIVFFDKIGISVKQGETVFPVLKFDKSGSIPVSYAEKTEILPVNANGEVESERLNPVLITALNPDWRRWDSDIVVPLENAMALKITSVFPSLTLDLLQNPPVNCAQPKRGKITRENGIFGVRYAADEYGVNCNGYSFSYLSSAHSYVMNITGKNYQGRGIKFFINYPNSEVLPEDYLMNDAEFDELITLHSVSDNIASKFHLNWEVRSFGKKNYSELSSIKIIPFPIDQLSMLSLKKSDAGDDVAAGGYLNNEVILKTHLSLFDSVHAVNYECRQAECYFGLDQTYDDLWLAIGPSQTGFLPHFRLNNWANLWKVSGSGTAIIFYLPELIALFSFVSLLIFIIILLRKTISAKKKQRLGILRLAKVKLKLLGKLISSS